MIHKNPRYWGCTTTPWLSCTLENMKNTPSLLWLFICCKTKLKNKYFFLKKKKKMFFTKYRLFAEKCFYMEKRFYFKIFFYWKKLFFYREKYKWKCKKIYISFEKYVFMQKMFMLQKKCKSFLNIYSFCKNNFLIIKNIFVKTLLWTQQSGP